MTLESLLRLIPTEAGRQHLLDLARQYTRMGPAAVDGGRDLLLDEIMHQIELCFRPIRHPLPTKQDLHRMLLMYSPDAES